MEPVRWYGVWLFVDWLEFGGRVIEAGDRQELAAIAAVELEAARRDPLPRAQPGLPPGRPQGAADQLGSWDGRRRHRAAKYFASGWCATSADVDCSGCNWNSSDSSTPIRPGSSNAITFV